jgi:hypothetical protein
MQLATSVYYNQDFTKKKEKNKKHHNIIAALRGSPPPTWPYIPSLLPLWTGGALLQGMPKWRTAQETVPTPTGMLPCLEG